MRTVVGTTRADTSRLRLLKIPEVFYEKVKEKSMFCYRRWLYSCRSSPLSPLPPPLPHAEAIDLSNRHYLQP